MTITVEKPVVSGQIDPGGSKSISNRILIMRALAKSEMPIYNVSESEDTQVLIRLLKENSQEWNVGDAGTAARFSAAYLATRVGEEHVLTGSERMKQRPMKPLLDALISQGAQIQYLEKEGFLPVKITGTQLSGGAVKLPSDISSQFVSALAMIAPYGKQDLIMEFDAELLSKPYADMTLGMLANMYIQCAEEYPDNGGFRIYIHKGTPLLPKEFVVEPDWSSASFWYVAAALSERCELELNHYTEDSLQGDSLVWSLFETLGVSTRFTEKGILIRKTEEPESDEFVFDFSDYPDLVPPFAVVLPLLKIKARLEGLTTLRYKESDRVKTLAENLKQLGVESRILENGNVLEIDPVKVLNPNPLIRCYGDHRIAMAFAPAVLVTGKISFDTPGVVNKSYPNFWENLRSTCKTLEIH
jgi:3-phosphoshikimate 1-carboxyvinyltransferase